MDARIPWLKLASINWVGETLKAGLIRELGSPQAIFSASPEKLLSIKGWTPARFDRFIRERHQIAPLCDPQMLDEKEIRMISFDDPEYPSLLRHIPDSPVVLFSKGGAFPRDERPHLSIVGARNASQLGFEISREFSRELARAGFVIVSGLAVGIDTYAHLGAIEGKGRTIAVLGCGVDIVYPTANKRTREEILKSGTIFSEYPPGTPARPWHFPIRNRIISGMCIGTLVIEASARSGSLITARLAGEQDREIFAVPGSIKSPLSEGTLALINEGAEMVTSPRQIIEHYKALLPGKDVYEEDETEEFSREENELLSALRNSPVHVDKLLSDGRWSRENLFSMLLTLELRDIVVKYPGNFFQAKK